MCIILAKEKDASKISKLIIGTIKKNSSKGYTKRELKGWLKTNPPEKFKKYIKNKTKYYLAVEGKEVVGVLSLGKKNDKIHALYVKSNKLKKGIGRKLFLHAEKLMKKKFKRKELYIESSLSAAPFYKKMGMKRIRKTKIKIGGVKIPVVLMTKKL